MTPAVPASEITRRIEALQRRLAACEPPLDAAVVVQNVDLYYLAGTIQTSHLVVPREGKPRLLVRKVLERARGDSPLEDIRPLASLKALPAEIRAACGPPPWRLGMELDVIPANLHRGYKEILGGDAEILDVSPEILRLRALKSDWEIEQIRAAAKINDRIYRDLPELPIEGLSTCELQAILDCRARTAGHVGLVRMRGFNIDGLIGVVASGPTGAMPGHSQFPIGGLGPHPCLAHGGDWEKIAPRTPIIFDYLANHAGYHHDQTRMAAIGGWPREAERIYEAMRALLRFTEERLRPGAAPSAIYEEAIERARELGFAEGLQGPPGHAVPFLGHAVGLEVNEQPVLARRFDEPLEPGMVLAVEPKFAHPELGVIGLENTYRVRAGPPENLGITPEEVIVKG